MGPAEALPCGNHVLKLCINSHVAYHVPLRTLFASLSDARFEHYSDVLVMLGGSAHDAPPLEMSLAEVVPGLESCGSTKVVVVRTSTNGFDYHGLSLLYRYRSHPLVAADTYLYLHDTTTVDPNTFIERFESFRLPRSPLLYTTWPLPNSNTVAFGAGVVQRFGHNFDANLTKAAAFPMEFGYPFEREGAPAVQPLISFGFVVKVGPRIPRGSSDLYATGSPRLRFFYPAFGVYKHSMRSDAAGDITGQRKTLFQGGRRYYPPGNDSKLARVYFASRPPCWDSKCRERTLPLGGNARPLQLPACTPRFWNQTGVSGQRRTPEKT